MDSFTIILECMLYQSVNGKSKQFSLYAEKRAKNFPSVIQNIWKPVSLRKNKIFDRVWLSPDFEVLHLKKNRYHIQKVKLSRVAFENSRKLDRLNIYWKNRSIVPTDVYKTTI